jgi:hypothetical protein
VTQKQVELRDAALADLNRATRKLQKAKKRPEAIKSQQVRAHVCTTLIYHHPLQLAFI